MPGITGQGTTFDLPNYVGDLFAASPEDTPLLSTIGGLTGGKEATATTFEWQGYDLRDPDENRQRLEGASAQNAEERVRFNVDNVVEIHQETVEVSYTKQAAIGQRSGANIDGTNPVTAELPWQVLQAIKQTARDVEASFIRGTYAKPADNSAPRKTRGILQAIQTNVINLGEVHAGLSASTTVITEASTTLANDDKVVFTDIGGSTGIRLNTVYYVVAKGTGVFSVAATKGGTALTIGTATVSLYKLSTAAPTKTTYDTIFQQVWDNGGLTESETATIMVGSSQKLNLSTAYSDGVNNRVPDRTIGGVNFETIVTDFGKFNVALNRWMPADAFTVLSLEQLYPVFLNVPGKGHFFQESLAKIGASDREQLYGEIGLEYGNEKAHGVIRGLPTTR